MNTNKNLLTIVSQAFYGNRTGTEIYEEDIDRFILGYQSNDLPVTEQINRTIIHVPNADNIVIIYNKYEEKEKRELKEELFKNKGHILEPLAIIPEKNIKLYSRCIVCRMDENGAFESLHEEDYEKFMKYLKE